APNEGGPEVADLNGDGLPDVVSDGPGSLFHIRLANAASFTGQVSVVGSLAERYVTQLYLDLLQRPPDSAGLTSLAGALEAGSLTAQQVATALVGSPEFQAVLVRNAFQTILGRPPEAMALAAGV